MCINKRYVNNRYIHQRVLVPCGKCDACLQAKANSRAARIRNHGSSGDLCLFLTLTYDNRFVPYVKLEDLYSAKSMLALESTARVELPIMRDFQYISRFDKKYIHYTPERIVSTAVVKDLLSYDYFPPLNKKSNCMGVILYDDVKRFMKRLRITLKRKLNYNEKITYYAVAEYGGRYKRPHFHMLVYFKQGTLETLRPIIAACWPYGDMLRSDKRIQQAVDASTYVASYVNKSASLPAVFQEHDLRQKFSHSLFFGHDVSCFSLDSLLEKKRRGDFTYSREIIKDGKPLLVSLPVPKYIINRWFPRFKGDCGLSCSEIQDILLSPLNLWNLYGSSEYEFNFVDCTFQDTSDGGRILLCEETKSVCQASLQLAQGYSRKEFYCWFNHLQKCIARYIDLTGKTAYDYAIDYTEVWTAYRAAVFKHSFDEFDGEWSNWYYNASALFYDPGIAPTLSFIDAEQLVLDPNKCSVDIRTTMSLAELKHKIDNQKEVVGRCLSELYDDI